MRIQVQLNDRGVDLINKIKEALDPDMSYKDLFDNAICLLDWSIQQRQHGRIIVSYNESDNSYRELAMPVLTAVKPLKAAVASGGR